MDTKRIIEKIENSTFKTTPFKHLEVFDLFADSEFSRVVESNEITIHPAKDDKELFKALLDSGYRIIPFPGCVTDPDEYIEWHSSKRRVQKTKSSCEGFGVVLRLEVPASDAIVELNEFISSERFVHCIAEKFEIVLEQCDYDCGIQKYVDGYEISPHPDVRKKALTYMVNINPGANSNETQIHTSYLEFKKEWRYVREYWEGRNDVDRCWVPWDWCNVVKQQTQNNSMIMFSPASDTMHAVKADYNHLEHQRTQLYGNLWYKWKDISIRPEWEDYFIKPRLRYTPKSRVRKLFDRLTNGLFDQEESQNSATHTKANIPR